ncbi:hypothetical protein ADUPG1_004968, partial [Aduncisulcus paluster]
RVTTHGGPWGDASTSLRLGSHDPRPTPNCTPAARHRAGLLVFYGAILLAAIKNYIMGCYKFLTCRDSIGIVAGCFQLSISFIQCGASLFTDLAPINNADRDIFINTADLNPHTGIIMQGCYQTTQQQIDQHISLFIRYVVSINQH